MTSRGVRSDVPPSMLVNFRGGNVRSFRAPLELSMLATTLASPEVVRHIPWRQGGEAKNVIGVLPAAAVFGANASGKSNVLRAMNDMRDAVLKSFRSWPPEGGTRRVPFKLDRSSAEEPTSFQLELVLDGVRHEYGFSLSDTEIVSEWAYRYPNGRQQLMFERERQDIRLGPSMSAGLGTAVDVVRANALLVSTAAALKGNELRPLYDWFRRNLRLAEADSRPYRQIYTAKLLDNAARRKQILALLTAADLGIVGVDEIDIDPRVKEKLEKVVRILNNADDMDADVEEGLIVNSLQLTHRGSEGDVSFDFRDESLGTQVWLGLVGPIVESLAEGSVLLADELDASLHPDLVEQVVRLFQDPAANPRRAQLIFNSHDANLLGDSSPARTLGRDQIWFTEKNSDGSSRLYALSDMNPRRNEALGRRYLDGRYGGTPILAAGDFTAAADLIAVGASH